MEDNWKKWCRLCANEDSSNIDINVLRHESNIPDALNNLFSINISEPSDFLSTMICLNCRETVKRIIEFGQKVSRVQNMFLEILNKNEGIDAEQIRTQYKLDEEFDKESIIINPIDKFYEPEITILQSTGNEEIDFLETSDIKTESSHEDSPDRAEDSTQPNEQLINDNDDLKSEIDTEESIEKPNNNKQIKTRAMQKSNISPIRCSECKKTFANLNSMKRHLRKQHGLSTKTPRTKSPFICEECGKICKSLPRLDEHKLVHVEDRPFKCRQCEKCFKNKLRLKYHEDTHSTTSYICTICGIRLNSKPTLNMHMVVHSDQKRFKCDYCGNEYKRAKALKTHLILHTGLKPYTCDFCDRTFANGSNCRSHKKKSHPVELAAMEAAGKFSSHTKVPELKDLRASLPLTEEIQNDAC